MLVNDLLPTSSFLCTTGDTAVLDPLNDHEELALRAERLGAVEDSTANRFFSFSLYVRPPPASTTLS